MFLSNTRLCVLFEIINCIYFTKISTFISLDIIERANSNCIKISSRRIQMKE